MRSILYQIFSDTYDITPKPDETQQKLYAQLFTETDKIQAALGEDFLDRLLELEGEQAHREHYQYYRSGFILGVRLMLEALRSD